MPVVQPVTSIASAERARRLLAAFDLACKILALVRGEKKSETQRNSAARRHKNNARNNTMSAILFLLIFPPELIKSTLEFQLL